MLNNQEKFKLRILFEQETVEMTFEDDNDLKVAIKVLDAGNINYEYLETNLKLD